MVQESKYDALISELAEKYAALHNFEYADFLRGQRDRYEALLENTRFTIKVKVFEFEETAKRIIKDSKIDETAMYINALDWEADKYLYNRHDYIYYLKKIADQNAEKNKSAEGEEKQKADEFNQFLLWRIDKCTAFLKEQAERFAERNSSSFIKFLKKQAKKYAENNNQDYAEFIRMYADWYTELIKQKEKDRAEEQRYYEEYLEILEAKRKERNEANKQRAEYAKKQEERAKQFKNHLLELEKEQKEKEEKKRREEEEKKQRESIVASDEYPEEPSYRKNCYTSPWDDDYETGQSVSQKNAVQQSDYDDYEQRRNEQMMQYEEEKHQRELQEERDRAWNDLINSGYGYDGYNNGGYGY